MRFSLFDIVVLSATGGAVYYLLRDKAKTPAAPAVNPVPEVKKLIKRVKSASRQAVRGAASKRSAILTDRSDEGRRVATENADGSRSHHRVGRGVKAT